MKQANKKSEAAEPSEKVLAARKKREADRARLRALKMNNLAANKENDPAPDMLIFWLNRNLVTNSMHCIPG